MQSVRSADGHLRVNSSHHQAIRTVGNDLKATAWASDDVIECVEDVRKDRFVVGVQWHPELTAEGDKFSLEIFERFVAACGASK
jgi:putative glutamine amidotransferase